MSESTEASSPGWDAIDRALAPLYAGIVPKHSATVLPTMIDGRDPLHGISAYSREAPIPHWHFITYGFTELFGKDSEDAEVNGFGFELTFRLTRNPADSEPPTWVFNFLRNIARYVFKSGNGFEHGHHLACNGPIALEEKTDLVAALFAHDPELGEFSCELGRARFLQVIGITSDEKIAIQSWTSTGVLELLQARLPLLTTDLSRKSILADTEANERVLRGIHEDGSSTGVLYLDKLQCKVSKPFFRERRAELVVVAGQVETIGQLLRGRLLHGRDLTLIRERTVVGFIPSNQNRIEVGESATRLHITADTASELARLMQPKAAVHPLRLFPELSLRIEKTEVTDADGKITKVIG